MVKLMNGIHSKAEVKVSAAAYAKLLKIAEGNGLLRDGRTNLDTHRMDGEDFLETSVWTISEILQQAYQAGYAASEKKIAKDLKEEGIKLNMPKVKVQ